MVISTFQCADCGHLSHQHYEGKACNWSECSCQLLVIPLTPRELQVMKLIASGEGVKGAARTLGLSVTTIEKHVVNMRTKAQVATMLELIILCLRSGVLSFADFPEAGIRVGGPVDMRSTFIKP